MAVWAAWLMLVVASFAIIEAWALKTGRPTLSRVVWDLSRKWPPLPLIVGAVIGFVCSHFWWGGALICY